MRVDLNRLIERWENGLRVLKALDPHERKKHFYMGFWGRKTDCGTVACAAGHMSLDSWFRRRGFCSVWDEPKGFEDGDAILEPTQDRNWGTMIREFFYVNPLLEDQDEYSVIGASELEILAERATRVFYMERGTHERVVTYIEATIRRLKEYRDRVKKPDPTTLPAGV